MIIKYEDLVFQDSHGKAECGCEWIHGTVVEMCGKHIEEMDDSLVFAVDEQGED